MSDQNVRSLLRGVLCGKPRTAEPEKGAILDAALALAETQLLAQVADDASFDGRTTGLVGLNGALLATDIAAKDPLGHFWWSPLPVLLLSTGLMLRTLFGPDRKGLDVGARAGLFYEKAGELESIPARELLLAELNKAFEFNIDRIRRKRRRLLRALTVLLAGLTVAALLITFDRPTKLEPCPSPSQALSKRCSSLSLGFRIPGRLEASPSGHGGSSGPQLLPSQASAPALQWSRSPAAYVG